MISWLNLFLTFFIFLISTIAMFLTGIVVYILYHFGLLSHPIISSRIATNPLFTPLMFLAILSIIVSTCISPLIIHFPLRSINDLIDGIDALARREFHTRLSLSGIGRFRFIGERFNSMAAELEHTTLLRNDFINNFSHEFKTPIVSIRGFAKLLKQENISPEQKEEYLNIIIHEADRLANLSAKVLDLSKIEGQTELYNTKTYNLAEQIRLSFLLLESKWSNKNIDFDIDLDEIKITANEEMMQQVFVNLIDNAIKFTPENGMISLSLKSEEDQIKFTLSDTGIGMTEEQVSRMFQKFYQADSSHVQEGNGLGLALVKQIVDLHHGTIEVKSQIGDGTTFIISFPCYRM